MLAFVTVGSTKFDALVQAVCSDAVLEALRNKGYTELVVQAGDSAFEHGSMMDGASDSARTDAHGIRQEYYRFKPSLREDYERADLIISHAGSGTILDVLRVPKPLIVVPNPTLLDNHQQELAEALEQQGHLRASTPGTLARDIEVFNPTSLVPFPPFDGSRFSRILDEEMGF